MERSKEKKSKSIANSGSSAPTRPGSSHTKSRMKGLRLEIVQAEPDLGAVLALMREWIVPQLVKEFLAEAAATERVSATLQQSSTSEVLGKERAE